MHILVLEGARIEGSAHHVGHDGGREQPPHAGGRSDGGDFEVGPNVLLTVTNHTFQAQPLRQQKQLDASAWARAPRGGRTEACAHKVEARGAQWLHVELIGGLVEQQQLLEPLEHHLTPVDEVEELLKHQRRDAPERDLAAMHVARRTWRRLVLRLRPLVTGLPEARRRKDRVHNRAGRRHYEAVRPERNRRPTATVWRQTDLEVGERVPIDFSQGPEHAIPGAAGQHHGL